MSAPPVSTKDLPPMVAAAPGAACVAWPDGSLEDLRPSDALALMAERPVGLAHAGFTARRLGADDGFRMPPPFDVLELFLFVRPGEPVLPHARDLARAVRAPRPQALEDQADALRVAAARLLAEAAAWPRAQKDRARPALEVLLQSGWPWAPHMAAALGPQPPSAKGDRPPFPDWTFLAEWEDEALPPPPGSLPVSLAEARSRLAAILGTGAETRPAQAEFAELAVAAFQPREQDKGPLTVLAEAGTGTGKTAAYLAPALSWVERNGHGLWISTFTKALQAQLSQTLEAIYPDPAVREQMVALRKGRENYLCLLNFDEAVARRRLMGGPEVVALVLASRWAHAAVDGDVLSGGFPAWAWPSPGFPVQLTLRAGECVYAACPHYRRCFVEKAVRKARRAPVVVANHALVMAEALRNARGPGSPVRYVFDEGHHLFDAADNAFAIHVTGREAAELRRWLRGPETRALKRGRGLSDRLGDLLADQPEAAEWAEEALAGARDLAGDGWLQRVNQAGARGASERFLAAVLEQIAARSPDPHSPYGAECEVRPVTARVAETADALNAALGRIAAPLAALAAALRQALADKTEEWDSGQRLRAEALARGLERRAHVVLPAWRSALGGLAGDTPPAFADWFGVARSDGRGVDIGFFRHWIDPALPLAQEVLQPSQGVLIASATLNDRPERAVASQGQELWAFADARTGVRHLTAPVSRGSFPSPFDFARQTRVFVVTDVDRADAGQLAGAVGGLFRAAGGGALALFTAIRSLRQVHERIAAPLAKAGVTLYAQHVDGMDAGTLVSLFRDEEDACLLGTDALRDGVDVPGRALRMVIFDRVPWPRPDILHKARRAQFGRSYDDALVRARIAQGFGRLIRRAADQGVFVILDARTPTRLLAGLPPAAPVARAGLAETVAAVRAFLGPRALAPGAAGP